MKLDNVLDTIRNEIHAERTLIAQRLTWYVASQSFLMTAYAIAGGEHHQWRAFFQYAMPPIGAMLSIMALIGVWSALEMQQDRIRQQTELLGEMRKGLSAKDPDAEKVLAEYQKTTERHSGDRFHKLAMTLPVMFLVAWIAAFVCSLVRG